MSGSGKAVPSKEFVDLEQNMLNADSMVNSTDLEFTNRASPNGNVKTTTFAGMNKLASDQRDQFEATFTAQFAYKRIGNISLYVGDSLPEVDKLNSYQYPDDSGEWYGPIQDQVFPITIPADPSSDDGWALVSALTKSEADSIYLSKVDGASKDYVDENFDKSATSLGDLKNIAPKATSNFIFVDGFSASGDGGDCVWMKKGFDALKAGDPFDLSLMEAYDSVGNIYEPYGIYGAQKLTIKPNAIGAIGNFLGGTGKDNILELEALRDYLQSKNGGTVLIDRFSFYGVSRCFKMGTSRTTSPDYLGTGQDSGFGKLDGFVSSPAPTATRDSVVRMNANDFTDSVGTFGNWDCSSFAVQAMDGSIDGVSGMSAVGAVRTSKVDNIRTDGGYDGIALTSCWSHIFTRNQSENAHNKGHVMGDSEYGEINDVVVNAGEFHGNIARGCGNWGLHYKFGSAIGVGVNTYETNDKNVWFQDIKSGDVSNLYCEGATGVDGIELKIGGNNSEGGIVQYTNFTGIISAFGGKKVLLRGMQDCELSGFRLDPLTPITSDNQGEGRVKRNKLTNARHDSTISKAQNETDTFIKGITTSSSVISHFQEEGRTIATDTVMTDVPASVTSVISSGIAGGEVTVVGHLEGNTTVMFVDKVYPIASSTAPAEEKNARNSPLARTYSMNGADLRLNIAGDYVVFVIHDGVRFI